MSGTFPTAPAPADVKPKSVNHTLVSRSHSGTRAARSLGGQWWTFALDYAPMTRADFAPIAAFIEAQQGQLGTFLFSPPDWKTLGDLTGSVPVVSGAPAAGDTSVSVSGLAAGKAGVGKAGDWLKFAGHTKAYRLTSNLDADGSGAGTAQFMPPLIAAPVAAEVITIGAGVQFTCALTGDEQEYTADAAGHYTYTVELAEVY